MSHAILNIAGAIAGMDLTADPGSQGTVSSEKQIWHCTWVDMYDPAIYGN